MKNSATITAAVLFLGALCGAAPGQVSTGAHLYTPPDPSATGGIRGAVTASDKPLVSAYAMPPDLPGSVYKGTVSGTGKREFSFKGLPAGKYDLLLVFEDVFYEGLTLVRKVDDLTAEDRGSIEAIVAKTEPYYGTKKIHRVAGQGGKNGAARCICTFFRAKESVGFIDGVVYPEHRRSLKLVLLEEVGPGWQVVKTREIHTVMVKPGTGMQDHFYRKVLGGIRVIDKVKDLGDIDLSAESPAEVGR
jgi:hypothetical protein